jgi:Uma2 family endonuclease
MSAYAAISLDEYLHTSFPGLDREFRDGELVERSMPDYPHGKCQLKIGAFFMALPRELRLYPCSETRLRLSNNRVLIPDVAVFHPDEPSGVPDSPPLVAIEILSPGDRLGDVREKLEEYRVWGVSYVWLVDPHSRRLYSCLETSGEGRLREVDCFRIEDPEVELSPQDIFDR